MSIRIIFYKVGRYFSEIELRNDDLMTKDLKIEDENGKAIKQDFISGNRFGVGISFDTINTAPENQE